MHDGREAERVAATDGDRERSPVDRRAVVLAGLGLMLGGCATGGGSSSQLARTLPEVPWDATGRAAAGVTPPTRSRRPAAATGTPGPLRLAGMQPRASWGASGARTGNINPMLPVQWITIHHDAMAYRGRTQADARRRMKMIQTSHQGHQNWADIGYHLVVDRRGTVWQGRELRWQGAHVGGANEGNVGIMLMGNFEEQRPTGDQIAGLQHAVRAVQSAYRVPASRIRTHREWPTAATDCPGRFLQSGVDGLRRARRFA